MDVCLLTPLAEGADQLAADVALAMGVALLVPLPMPVTEYLGTFQSDSGRSEFHRLCDAAADVFELQAPGTDASDAEHFAHLGVFLASHCHLLLAVWDGRNSGKAGGTGQVVRFHHDDVMPGFPGKTAANRQLLIDDESDLVFHIPCSRKGDDNPLPESLVPMDYWWFTKDENSPRTKLLPDAHHRVLSHANEFSRDACRLEARIVAESDTLLDGRTAGLRVEGIESIDRSFRNADFLATHYQKRSLHTLRAVHSLAFLMGVLLIGYSDVSGVQGLLYLFLACFGGAALVQQIAIRRGWFRKYLDYRALAEALRVQFYWALAGVGRDDLEAYSHDNFLQLQNPDVGWIRNTMRVAGMLNDANSSREMPTLDLAIEQWVGSPDTGQLGYYAKKVAERTRRQRITDGIGKISLAASALVIVALLLAGTALSPQLTETMLAIMGATLLLFAVRHGFAHAIAESELIKQYQFMLQIFTNARRRLSDADDDAFRREVLVALGRAALDEHAQWLMMHRERSVDQTEIWRIGSGS